MRRGALACLIVILFLLQTFSNANFVLTESSTSNSYREDVLFNQSGFYEDGVYTTPDGECTSIAHTFSGLFQIQDLR